MRLASVGLALGGAVVVALAALVGLRGMRSEKALALRPSVVVDEHDMTQSAGGRGAAKAGIYGERPGQALLGVYNGVEVYFFWPADPIAPHLSADEAEFILVNTNETAATLRDPVVTFAAGSLVVDVYSGTWEAFPSRSSWERSSYVNIGQGQYRGTLALAPGEKGKLHYHLTGSPTMVRLTATLAVSGESVAVAVAAERALTSPGADDHGAAGALKGGH